MNLQIFCTEIQEIGIALFALAILWGAVRIMFAGEDERIRIEGKNTVKNAVIGLILILIASTMVKLFSGITLQPLTFP